MQNIIADSRGGDITVAGGQVDATRIADLSADEAAARSNGFAPAPPVYALGSRVVSWGVDNFKRSREEFEGLPSAAAAIPRFLQLIMAENRVDVPVHVNQLRMLEDGTITRGGNRLMVDERSFGRLLQRTACPEPGAAAKYLARLSPERRAYDFNLWARETDSDQEAVLRTRLIPGGTVPRGLYGVVSTRYNPEYNVDVLAARVLSLIPGDCRCDLEYDGTDLRMRLLWHTDIAPELACAGEFFKAGLTIESGDDGGTALSGSASMWRNLCLNLIIVDESRQHLGRIIHVGETQAIHEKVMEIIALGTSKVRYFAEKWDRARAHKLDEITRDMPELTRQILQGNIGGDVPAAMREVVEGVLRGLLKSQVLHLPGLRRPAALNALMASYEKEPEFTRVGLVNAITRTAHEAELGSMEAASILERAGGKLLVSSRPLAFVGAAE